MNAIKTLEVFNKWRIGEDVRTLDEIGLSTSDITRAINQIIADNRNMQHALKMFIVEQQRYRPQLKKSGVKHYLIRKSEFDNARIAIGEAE